ILARVPCPSMGHPSVRATSLLKETTAMSVTDTITLGGDLTVRRLGFGAMRLSGPLNWGPPRDWDEAVGVARRAVELGVNFIDTADAYGPGLNEELLADALYPYPDGLVIATKAGQSRPSPDDWIPLG